MSRTLIWSLILCPFLAPLSANSSLGTIAPPPIPFKEKASPKQKPQIRILPLVCLKNKKSKSSNSVLNGNACTTWAPKNETLRKTYMSLLKEGKVNKVALLNSFRFYEANLEKHQLSEDFIAIADYTKSANLHRYYWVDLKTGAVKWIFRLAHGENSGSGLMATKCDGTLDSNTTPCGFHKYGEGYIGRNGLSIKMHGLQEGINLGKNGKTVVDSIDRYIVAHMVKYVEGNLNLNATKLWNQWLRRSTALLYSLSKNDIELYYSNLPSDFKNGYVMSDEFKLSKTNTDTETSNGCQAFGPEDFAKLLPFMKNVMTYNYFGEGFDSPTQMLFVRKDTNTKTAKIKD